MYLMNSKVFQSAAENYAHMSDVYRELVGFLVVIVSFLMMLFMYKFIFKDLFMYGYTCRYMSDNEMLESSWTIFPMVILGICSMFCLSGLSMEESLAPYNSDVFMKATGNQWYWNYEYYFKDPDIKFDSKNEPVLDFNSFMLSTDENLVNGSYRLLDVDNRFVLPTMMTVNIGVTSSDVIHSWVIPSINVNIGSVPGHLNLIKFSTKVGGVVYGQCYEICGLNHASMPIVGELVPPMAFDFWINSFKLKDGVKCVPLEGFNKPMDFNIFLSLKEFLVYVLTKSCEVPLMFFPGLSQNTSLDAMPNMSYTSTKFIESRLGIKLNELKPMAVVVEPTKELLNLPVSFLNASKGFKMIYEAGSSTFFMGAGGSADKSFDAILNKELLNTSYDLDKTLVGLNNSMFNNSLLNISSDIDKTLVGSNMSFDKSLNDSSLNTSGNTGETLVVPDSEVVALNK